MKKLTVSKPIYFMMPKVKQNHIFFLRLLIWQ